MRKLTVLTIVTIITTSITAGSAMLIYSSIAIGGLVGIICLILWMKKINFMDLKVV